MKVESAEFIRSAVGERDFPNDGLPQVAFVGRSNVGKSSLLNKLLGKGLARTSSTPGRTRAVNLFLVNRRVYFADLPGYGYAKAGRADREAWAELIDTYLRSASPRVVLLVDSRIGATPLDEQAFEYLLGLEAEIQVVATKIDKVPRGRRKGTLEKILQTLGAAEDTTVIPISAETGEGVRELWQELEAHFAAGAGTQS
jgi:GTP-binding protein